MDTSIIHISDLHYQSDWQEAQGDVIRRFFEDLEKQTPMLADTQVFFAISGDIVQAGDNEEQYAEVMSEFGKRLDNLGIPNSQRICVPGNHDVSDSVVAANAVDHRGVVNQTLSEVEFNNYVETKPAVFIEKFSQYKEFEQKFANYGVSNELMTGQGWEIGNDVGVYCLNSAWCSSAKQLSDRGKLNVDTRRLHKWTQDTGAIHKILLMHHPLDWLSEWAQQELRIVIRRDFSLCLSGHVHSQNLVRSIDPRGADMNDVSAPPLHSTDGGELGYSIIRISQKSGVHRVKFRQWAVRLKRFVPGVNFSGTDDGCVVYSANSSGDSGGVLSPTRTEVSTIYEGRLETALRSFTTLPSIWVDPVLSRDPLEETDQRQRDKSTQDQLTQSEIEQLIRSPQHTVIQAPPHFGLTSLAHYFCKTSWNLGGRQWLYIDATGLRPNKLAKALQDEAKELGCDVDDAACVILDGWSRDERYSDKLLQKLHTELPNTPIILMQRTGDLNFSELAEANLTDIDFSYLFLRALSRGGIRQFVSKYNETKFVGDEDAVVNRLVSDLEILNLHRTPLNCATLLKVWEADLRIVILTGLFHGRVWYRSSA